VTFRRHLHPPLSVVMARLRRSTLRCPNVSANSLVVWYPTFLVALPVLFGLLSLAVRSSRSMTQTDQEKSAARGLDHLLHRSYGHPVLTQAEFDRLWTVWETAWKTKAESNPALIRSLTLERYGFTPSLDPKSTAPLQLVSTKSGLVITCLACHAGRVPGTGQVMIGMPNTDVDLTTFIDDVNKLRGGSVPAGLFQKTRGHTNAVFMTHVLLMFRNPKGYDRKGVGLLVESLSGPAPADLSPIDRRRVVDTTVTGMSNQGHPFGFKLTEEEKQRVIEYLKTL